MPTVYRANLNPEVGATSVERTCSNCGNLAPFELHYAKEGIGLGVPIVSMFTDKATLARKSYYLVCSICSSAESVSRDAAAGLKRGA